MPNLKLGLIPDEKPVKLSVELPAGVHRDLIAYGEVLARETGQAVEPSQLVAPMLARFMSADRGFSKMRRSQIGEGQSNHDAFRRSNACTRAELRNRLKAGLSFCADHTMLNGISSWSRGRNVTPG